MPKITKSAINIQMENEKIVYWLYPVFIPKGCAIKHAQWNGTVLEILSVGDETTPLVLREIEIASEGIYFESPEKHRCISKIYLPNKLVREVFEVL